ncbi:hypothetical protein [Actinokineospora globicatena]|uniref:hypothetical protein n=1 Tax=Actinokineospora globicatena TaxID=103729 RepID=UPI0020A464D6|nr:hypothetical protein [Actinokineospora globicatena]MCP2303981.1 hypothetical protein [Actinokineospora globicatena]GLW78857.1 hypothetical protein Aglo01_33390 [Actinokineospora globicatena]GLW86730.1 hypothetical protein Aglo02_43690 [Actinokineospora globicatena]
MSVVARTLGVAAAALVVSTLLPGTATAAARVSLSVSTADPDYATAVEVRGTGFQSVPKAHGGIYVLFGWVDGGAWQPSKGGAAGSTYRYVQDSEAKDNNGYQRFVSFPGSDTASSANGGVVTADGTWSARMVIPGARFRAVDRTGSTTEVDCTKVICGIITIGAHGVVNPTNETFTPVRFAAPAGGQTQPAPTAAPSTNAVPGTAAPLPARAATLSTDAGVVAAGGTVAVTGSGFAADEQVTVVLRSDPLFLAPAKADAAGALSYSAAIPGDVPAGAHTLEFTGAKSGAVGSVPLTVSPATPPSAAPAVRPASSESSLGWWPVGASVVLVVIVLIVLLRKRKKVEA